VAQFHGTTNNATKTSPASTSVMSDLQPAMAVTYVTTAQLTCARDRETMAIDCQRAVPSMQGISRFFVIPKWKLPIQEGEQACQNKISPNHFS
jgi:hypothetical protein